MRVRYGKPIKVKSLFGLQNNSTANISNTNRYFRMIIATNTFESGSGIYNNSLYKGASISNEDYLFLVIKTNIEASNFGACYFTQNTAVNYTNLTEYKTGNIIVIKQKLSTSSSDTDTYHFRLSQPTQVTYKVNYAFLLNASEIGLDNLTAEQFYNKYNKYFSLIATGEEITIDDKAGQIAYKNLEEDSIRCKIAGGSSDIYYGYNQLGDTNYTQYKSTNGTLVLDEYGATLTKGSDGPWSHSYLFQVTTAQTKQSHKYYYRLSVKWNLSDITGSQGFLFNQTGGLQMIPYANSQAIINDNEWHIYEGLITATQNSTDGRTYLVIKNNAGGAGLLTGDTVSIKNYNCIDLTDWFGAGKEPSTVAEFKEKFTKEYYGFCKTPIKLTKYQIEALPSYGYNQVATIKSFTNNKTNGITYSSIKNESITFNGTGTGGSNVYFDESTSAYILEHKYLLKFIVDGTQTAQSYISMQYRVVIGVPAGTYNNQEFYTIKKCTYDDGSGYHTFCINNFGNTSQTYTNFKISNYMFIDLTDWYGAGSEPTTIEEFKSTFPNIYYPYSSKTLLNKYMINKLVN